MNTLGMLSDGRMKALCSGEGSTLLIQECKFEVQITGKVMPEPCEELMERGCKYL